MSAQSLTQKRSPGAAGRGAAFTPDLNTRPPIRAFYGLRDLHHQPMQREAQANRVSPTVLTLGSQLMSVQMPTDCCGVQRS